MTSNSLSEANNLLESLENIESTPKQTKGYTDADIIGNRITSDSNIPEPKPVIKILGANFAIEGDISFISGQPKAGKTHVCAVLIATALMKVRPPDLDTLGIQCEYCEGREVIYVDTEQPKPYAKKLLDSIKNYLNVFREPENFHFYNLRKYENSKKFNVIKKMFEMYPNTFIWIIDGIADLVKNINSEEETSDIMSWFMAAADNFKSTIILVLHENPSTDKMRGHLGSEAMRKAGGAISIKKDRKKRIHWIESRVIRGSDDFENIYFQYDNEKKRMLRIDATPDMTEQFQLEEATPKKDLLTTIVRRCFVNNTTLNHKALVDKVMVYDKYPRTVSKRTAITRVKEMLEMEIIFKDTKGEYCFTDNPFN